MYIEIEIRKSFSLGRIIHGKIWENLGEHGIFSESFQIHGVLYINGKLLKCR